MTTAADTDPFVKFKAAQREAWAAFAPVEIFTAAPAAKLVKFAQVASGERVLDVACGTGVVALTAARRGAKASGLDLSPALIERARKNADIAGVDIDFVEGDAEALPYPDGAFDVVLSQFGHIFAPRPAVAVREMLRVLRTGGRIAFSTWPPELFLARFLAFIPRFLPPPPPDAATPESPVSWGDPNVIRERLGDAVAALRFERDTMIVSTLSPQHFRVAQERAIGQLAKAIDHVQHDPARLAELRTGFEALINEVFEDNQVHQHYLMTCAVKA
jgi:SAM-dependent methyltransferase